jgi:hypothetical protein
MIIGNDKIALILLFKVRSIVFTTSLTPGIISTPERNNLIVISNLRCKILLALIVDTAYPHASFGQT